MDLPEIGAHCSLQSCNELDLLPIKCSCGKQFCRKHIQPDAHECELAQTQVPLSVPEDPLKRCAFAGCSKLSLNAYNTQTPKNATGITSENSRGCCPNCQQSFCAEHRFPTEHSCTSLTISDNGSSSSSEKNARARELLRKNFPQLATAKESASKSTTRTGKSASGKAQIKKVQLMKLRQSARPGDPRVTSLSPLERHHVVVQCRETDVEKTFWFSKKISVGRMLDLVAKHFNLSISDKRPLRIYDITGDIHEGSERRLEHLALDQELSQQTTDGCTLLITRGASEEVNTSVI